MSEMKKTMLEAILFLFLLSKRELTLCYLVIEG